MYIYMRAYSSKTRPNWDFKIEDKVHMISRITHVHWRSRVLIHVHANVRAALHIQRWHPNGWTDRDPNWYKHTLGQSAQVMEVAVVPRKWENEGESTWVEHSGTAISRSVEQKKEKSWWISESTWMEHAASTKRECAARAARIVWSKTKVA
jgi:hypothetical protein